MQSAPCSHPHAATLPANKPACMRPNLNRRQDEGKIKELGMAVEKLTKEVAVKKEELEEEVRRFHSVDG